MGVSATRLDYTDLIDNPTPRVPVCLVLDCSPSMSGETRLGSVIQQTNPRPIDELNSGIATFFREVMADDIARHAAEVAVVAFAGEARVVREFASLERVSPPRLATDMLPGGTHVAAAVRQGLQLLDGRKEEYRRTGVDYFQPWLVLMTDGRPTDGDAYRAVAAEVASRVAARSLSVFPIGIGDGADMDVLAGFSPQRSPLRLKGLAFAEFFRWLSRSVVATSMSMPGEEISLDLKGIAGWGTL